MIAKIEKSVLAGNFEICPSKSYEQRAWAIASLAGSAINIFNSGTSADVLACKGIAGKIKNHEGADNSFDCGESALCARMFPPIIALHKNNFTLTGKGSLTKRQIVNDIRFYAETFGWKIDGQNFPFKISNASIKHGEYTIDGSSTSQIVSGLVIALSSLKSDSILTVKNCVSTGYILLTIDMLNKAGAKIQAIKKANSIEIHIGGNTIFKNTDFHVEGDWSNAAFIIAASINSGNVQISGLNPQSLQPDKAILQVLDMCQANYRWEKQILSIGKSKINGFAFNATDCPDLIPPLCALAIKAQGECKIYGINRLVGKESNRLETIFDELKKLGVNVSLSNNCFTINQCRNTNSATVDSHNDHRIAMMLATIGLSVGNTQIDGCECVNKSYPDFFDTLKLHGANLKIH